MGILGFIIVGLIAGSLAKAILPGKQGGGWISTLILGVAGAIVGGWLGGLIFNQGIGSFWSIYTWLLALGGSVIVLFVWGLIKGRKSS